MYVVANDNRLCHVHAFRLKLGSETSVRSAMRRAWSAFKTLFKKLAESENDTPALAVTNLESWFIPATEHEIAAELIKTSFFINDIAGLIATYLVGKRPFKVGDFLDSFDCTNQWFSAKILAEYQLTPGEMKVAADPVSFAFDCFFVASPSTIRETSCIISESPACHTTAKPIFGIPSCSTAPNVSLDFLSIVFFATPRISHVLLQSCSAG